MSRPRILLADDHLLMTEALRHLLQVEFEVVDTVADGEALLSAAERLRPDLVVVDIGMPNLNGLDAGQRLQATDPAIKVVYLTPHREPRLAFEALRRHASGYVLKDSAASELTAAIREALQGRQYVSRSLADELARLAREADPERTGTSELSRREREVLQLLAQGKSMKEVAAALGISARTVEFHKYRIMRRLDARTNAELVQQALRLGLITS
jgi:DNA-binding NarL/FixJ family response regulator